MLLDFNVKNYLSFKEKSGFTMKVRNQKLKTLPNNKNIIKTESGENLWINKSLIFYGANASGKTNILKGLSFLRDITLHSFSYPINGGINHNFLDSFSLDVENKKKPIAFSVTFLIDKVKYYYVLELNSHSIVSEKLSYFIKAGEKEVSILNRDISSIKFEDDFFGFENIKKSDFVENKLYPRDNQTFISKMSDLDSSGKSLATKIVNFFGKINFIDSRIDLTGLTLQMLNQNKNTKEILDFIINADNNIEKIEQQESEFDITKNNDIPFIELNGKRIIPEKIIETAFIHPVYKDKEKIDTIGFNLEKQESLGTQKLFSLLGPILDTIERGGILLIDEIDTHMHFLLIENLIKFLHSKKENGENSIGNAQFIFNTHNLDLMDLSVFKKDQIYFTSKDYYGATEIYSLNDFKDIQIRKTSDIKKAYKLGVFGAIPILSDF